MNSRERVKKVLAGEIPDRAPRALYGTSIGVHNATTLKLFDKMTGKHPREAFKQDLLGVFPEPYRTLSNSEEHKKAREMLKSTSPVKGDQLKTAAGKLTCCDFNMDIIHKRLEEIHSSGYASVLLGSRTLLESGCAIRGREQFYMDLAYHEDWLEPFLDVLTESAIAEARNICVIKPDIFCYGDDVGAQRGLIISPAQWAELFNPRHKRILEAVKETSPETKVAFHCCGDSGAIIEQLIEIGVDILNPIQPKAIAPEQARKLAGDRLILWGGICVQQTMSRGTPEDVMMEIKSRMETIGKNGRYILSPAHMLNDDIPWENIMAFFEGADLYGKY